tara:strand:+ start:350 stop:970 length:621 start_codon:yes stop_codon:yes gene_type:complete
MNKYEYSNNNKKFEGFVKGYTSQLIDCFSMEMNHKIFYLAQSLGRVWNSGNNVFLCGNGGSAGNAIHIANDFIYGIGNFGKGSKIPGIRVSALSANPAVLTCLGNDIGFENIFSYQLKVQAKKNDLLIALSGSGNSPNIVSALNTANQIGLKTFAILAFTGGKCKKIAKYPLHFNINDMQIAEDLQLIIGHLCMQWLSNNKSEFFG